MTAISTTVTFDDLIAAYDDELADLREAYDDLVEWATDEHGDERVAWPDEALAKARQLDSAAQTIQKRQHVLERLADEYDDGAFTLKMLSGAELMDIETELRMEANSRGISPQALDSYREQLVVDAAVTDAPDAAPRDDDGNPLVSECPNPLVFALSEQAERLNTAGETDFRAPGFGERAAATSATPATSGETSSDSHGITPDSDARGTE